VGEGFVFDQCKPARGLIGSFVEFTEKWARIIRAGEINGVMHGVNASFDHLVARPDTGNGMVIPSALTVLKLMISWIFVAR